MLRGLDEGHVGAREERHACIEEVRLDDVVRVHYADDLDVWFEPPRGFIEGAGLEARPAGKVDEPEPRPKPAAVLFHRHPELGICGVVDDHLDGELRIVEPGEGIERLPQQVGRLVVGGYLQANPGSISVGIRRRSDRKLVATDRVGDLEGERESQRQRAHLQYDQNDRPPKAKGRPMSRKRDRQQHARERDGGYDEGREKEPGRPTYGPQQDIEGHDRHDQDHEDRSDRSRVAKGVTFRRGRRPVAITSTGRPMDHLATRERLRAMKARARSAREERPRARAQSTYDELPDWVEMEKGRGLSPTLSGASVVMACLAWHWASRRDDWSAGRSGGRSGGWFVRPMRVRGLRWSASSFLACRAETRTC